MHPEDIKGMGFAFVILYVIMFLGVLGLTYKSDEVMTIQQRLIKSSWISAIITIIISIGVIIQDRSKSSF